MHNHNHSSETHRHDRKTIRALQGAFLLNLIFMIIEVVTGILTNSLVLLSDAGHMVSDVAALALALFTELLVRHKATPSFTFGYRRAPVLGAFGNALALYIIVVLIFWEAWDRLLHPPQITAFPVLLIGCLGLAVNAFSAIWLMTAHTQSLNIKGAILHLFADALGSIGAVVAALIMLFRDWALVDPLVSIAIGCIILAGTWPLMRDSVRILLQAAPERLPMDQIQDFLLTHPAVERIDDLHVWELNSGDFIFSASLVASEEICSLLHIQEINEQLHRALAERFAINHATFEWRTRTGSPRGCEKQTRPRRSASEEIE
ncbi:cation transporter [bacterium]|nr:cation transporter [bacterium]